MADARRKFLDRGGFNLLTDTPDKIAAQQQFEKQAIDASLAQIAAQKKERKARKEAKKATKEAAAKKDSLPTHTHKTHKQITQNSSDSSYVLAPQTKSAYSPTQGSWCCCFWRSNTDASKPVLDSAHNKKKGYGTM